MKSGRQAVEYFFELSLYLFVTTGFIAVAVTGKLDLPSVLVVGTGITLRGLAFLGLTHIFLQPSTVTRLTIAYMLFYAVDYLLLSGSFVFATGHLVFYLLLMKLFSARTNRDYLYLSLIAFMEMLLAAVLTINTSFLGLFCVFLLFGIATFASFEMRRAYLAASEGNVPAADVQGRPQIMLRGLAMTSLVVTVGVLVSGALLFFFIPRLTTGYLSSLASQSQQVSGFSDNVLLGEIGTIKQSAMVVMHVRLQWAPPDVNLLRWRGVGLTTFDGRRWMNETNSIVLPSNANNYFLQRGYEEPGSPPFYLRYSVMLEPISSDALFLAPVPVTLSGRFRILEMDGTDSVSRHDSSFNALRYDATSNLKKPRPEALRRATEDYSQEITARYLQLPQLDPRIRKLAEDVTQAAPTAYDKAAAIELHLRSKYGYSLEMASQGPDPVADFLFRVRRGHCEYFASAMTVMLRTQGIPTRLVNGFLPGEYNDISQQYVVRGNDAHSWVEVFFPGYGWVSFDPTPAAGTVSGTGGFTRIAVWVDALHPFWNDWVVSYDFTRQFILMRQLDRNTRTAGLESQNYFRRRYTALRLRIEELHRRLREDPTVLPAVILTVLLGVLTVLLWPSLAHWWRQAASRSRVRAGRAGVRDVTQAYQHLLDFLAGRGVHRTPAMTARQLAAEVRDPALAPLVSEFATAYEEARFGGAIGRLPELYELLAKARGASSRVKEL